MALRPVSYPGSVLDESTIVSLCLLDVILVSDCEKVASSFLFGLPVGECYRMWLPAMGLRLLGCVLWVIW